MASTAKPAKPEPSGRPRRETLQAVGSYEAACLMGVHFTTPNRMIDKGLLTGLVSGYSAYTDQPSREYAIYDGAECERNFLEYEEKVAERGGKSDRRPRSWLHLRPEVLKRLRAVEPKIEFSDAIGASEAARILGVHVTFIARMVRGGHIKGRQPWNPRSPGRTSGIWIISRSSCQENAKKVRSLEAAGKKVGRKRHFS